MDKPFDLSGRKGLWETPVVAEQSRSTVYDARAGSDSAARWDWIAEDTGFFGLERQVRVPLPYR
jgi:hypothetical protein